MAFQIFYIAINVSVIAAPLISGTLGEKVGWHYGFGTAGVVMVAGLLLYLKAGPWLPQDSRDAAKNGNPAPPMTATDWPRLFALLLLIPVLALSMLTNQEIFNAYLVWADEQFQLTFFGTTLPTTYMITIDAALSFAMLAAVALFWKWRTDRGHWEPDEIGKMILGSVFVIMGGLCLYMAALTQGAGKIGLGWPLLFHLFNSIGFAHIMPVSLALFTKVAPRALNATVIGIYYLTFFSANKIVGVIGGWYSSMPTPQFWLMHVGTAVAGLVGFVLFRLAMGKVLKEPSPA